VECWSVTHTSLVINIIMLVEHIINEAYVNAIGTDPKAIATKKKYLKQVWDILQSSYESIGGIKGNGFQSPEAMLELPMWKLGVRDGRVHAVAVYKDKNGRKAVAVGTDGSNEGKWFISDMFKNEFERSYSEKSKAALGATLKTYPFKVLEPFIISPDRVAEMNPQDRIIPIADLDRNEWPGDARLTLSKYPQLIDYGYMRDIGGELVFKVMIGTPGKNIK
jgi:hypothetical protein